MSRTRLVCATPTAACIDGRCEAVVRVGTSLPLPSSMGVADVEVSKVSDERLVATRVRARARALRHQQPEREVHDDPRQGWDRERERPVGDAAEHLGRRRGGAIQTT